MNKIEKILSILEEQNLDGLYITKKSNVNYTTGYPDELAYTVISKI